MEASQLKNLILPSQLAIAGIAYHCVGSLASCLNLTLDDSGRATIGYKLHLKRVTSENKTIHTPPLSPPFKVGVFVVFYR